MSEADGPMLRATDLSVRYSLGERRHKVALDNVSMAVAQGEIVGIVGESGSGKTTLGKALAGFVPVSTGTVHLGDELLSGSRRRERRSWGVRPVQMVFQDPLSALDPRWPVWRSVGEPVPRSTTREERKARAVAALGEVGIAAEAAERYPSELSGGQRQRVTIARALVSNPRFLVCDEITSGLDVSIRGGVLNVLRSAQATAGFGCVFITHDITMVARLAQRLVVVYQGEVVEEGLTLDVINNPRSSYTMQLMKSVPRLAGSEGRS